MSKFQSFEDLGGPGPVAARIADLRAALAAQGFAGFLIPRADRHQNEYLPAGEERLLWATGFSGSAGFAIVLAEAAALFVDGRYTEQAALQTDVDVFERLPVGEKALQNWLRPRLKPGDALGFDPWNHTADSVAELKAFCESLGAHLTPVAINPIDALWTDRPAPPRGPSCPDLWRWRGRRRKPSSPASRKAWRPTRL